MRAREQAGFTIVELVVTLFVATLLIIAGYNLYGIVTKNAAEARRMSEASSIAYDILRTRAASTSTLNCPANDMAEQTTDSSDRQKAAKLPDGQLKVYCGIPHDYMQRLGGGLVLLKVQIAYEGSKRKVEHAIYVAK